MQFRILAAAIAGLTAALCLATPALASPARPSIQQMAHELHEENLEGGLTLLSNCHLGAQNAVVVCSVTLTGVAESPEGIAEATCTTAIASVWRSFIVEGFGHTSYQGFWFPRVVSDVECEGTLI